MMDRFLRWIATISVIVAAARASRPAVERAGPGVRPGSPAGAVDAVPVSGWKPLGKRLVSQIRADNVPTVAAAMAYYGFLALFPALIALVSFYGLVADPADVQRQVDQLSAVLPGEAAGELVREQLDDIVSSSSGGLGIGLALSLAGVLWSVSSGMAALIKAVNLTYDEVEDRSFLQLRGLAMTLTVVLLVGLAGAVYVIAGLPRWLERTGLSETVAAAIQAARWPLVAVGALVGLAIFYRYAPNRRPVQWRWVSWGAVTATLLWIVASAGLNLYVSRFGTYNETYGAIGGVIVMLLWIYVTSLSVLVGAELDAELLAHPGRAPREEIAA